jgi:hypothetical protein
VVLGVGAGDGDKLVLAGHERLDNIRIEVAACAFHNQRTRDGVRIDFLVATPFG